MPYRIRPHDLIRLLDRSAQPVYLVDDQGQLVFVNQAVSRWVGLPAEELLGQTCKFQDGNGLQAGSAIAFRLCPPPESMAGAEAAIQISVTTSDAVEACRLVRFVPLKGADGEVVGVLALAGESTPEEGLAAPAGA